MASGSVSDARYLLSRGIHHVAGRAVEITKHDVLVAYLAVLIVIGQITVIFGLVRLLWPDIFLR